MSTPIRSNKWFRLAIVFALLYGATFSLWSVFNWIFFISAVYCFWLDWYLNPDRKQFFQRQTHFQGGSREGGQSFGGGRQQTKAQGSTTQQQRAKRVVAIVVGSFVMLFAFLIIVGILADDDTSETIENTSEGETIQDLLNSEATQEMIFTSKGNELFNAGQYDSADYYYDKALAIKSDYWEAVYGKGIVLWQNNRQDEANAFFVRAYEGGYRYSWLSWQLGAMYDQRNETSRAISLYKESLQMDSANAPIYQRLAQLEPANAAKYNALAVKYKD